MQCKLIKNDKKRCKAIVLKGGEFCYYHSPKNRDDRVAASSRGGENSKKNNVKLTPVKISNPEDVLKIVSETINLLRSGKVHPNYANSIFIGCNTFFKSYEKSLNYRMEKKFPGISLIDIG